MGFTERLLCYRLKHRWRDGTTHIVLEPVALLERLAACIPPPRFHLVRYHGILAPCASWRDHVVPCSSPPVFPDATGAAEREASGVGATPPQERTRYRDPGDSSCEAAKAPSGARSVEQESHEGESSESNRTVSPSPHTWSAPRARRLSWAQLLQRVFAVDAFVCPRCGDRMRLLAAIESPGVIRAILDCLGLPSRAPPLAPAEPEPLALELGFDDLPLIDA
jgi:hypothetical protein